MSDRVCTLQRQHAIPDWLTIREAVKISKKNRLYENK